MTNAFFSPLSLSAASFGIVSITTLFALYYEIPELATNFITTGEKSTQKSLDPLTKFIIGVSVFLVSSALSSLGLNLQALALQAQRARNSTRAQELAREEELAAQLEAEFDDLSSDFFSEDENVFADDEVYEQPERKPLLHPDTILSNSLNTSNNSNDYGAISSAHNFSLAWNVTNISGVSDSSTIIAPIPINSSENNIKSHDSQLYGTPIGNFAFSESSHSRNQQTEQVILVNKGGSISPTPASNLASLIKSNDARPQQLELRTDFPSGKVRTPRRETIIAAAAAAEKLKKERERKEWWKDFMLKWQWYLGLALYIITQMFGSVVALIFISPMVLAPLGSSGLIFNVLFSSFFLGTPITKIDWIGTLLIVIGCSLVSYFGDQGGEDKKQTMEELIRLITRTIFIVYFAIQNVFALSVLALVKYLENSKLNVTTPLPATESFNELNANSSLYSAPAVTSTTSLLREHAINVDHVQDTLSQSTITRARHPSEHHHHRYRKASAHSQRHRHQEPPAPFLNRLSAALSSENSMTQVRSLWDDLFCVRFLGAKIRGFRRACASWLFSNIGTLFAIVGGIIASETLLLTKSGVELLLVSIIDSENQFQGMVSVTILIVLVATIVLQLYCLNRALYHSHPVVAIPLFFTLFTCCSLTGSVVYFDTISYFSALALLGIAVGLACLVGGVWLLRESQAQGHEAQKKIEEEAAIAALEAAQAQASANASPRLGRL